MAKPSVAEGRALGTQCSFRAGLSGRSHGIPSEPEYADSAASAARWNDAQVRTASGQRWGTDPAPEDLARGRRDGDGVVTLTIEVNRKVGRSSADSSEIQRGAGTSSSVPDPEL